MKKIIVLFAILLSSLTSFCQQVALYSDPKNLTTNHTSRVVKNVYQNGEEGFDKSLTKITYDRLKGIIYVKAGNQAMQTYQLTPNDDMWHDDCEVEQYRIISSSDKLYNQVIIAECKNQREMVGEKFTKVFKFVTPNGVEKVFYAN